MRRLLCLKPLLLALALAGSGALRAGPGAHGPNGEHLDGPAAAAPGSGLARLPDGSVQMPKGTQRRLAIRTMVAPQSDAAAGLELAGRVVADPSASGRVQAVHGGRIEAGPKGLPRAGQAVRQGEVLAYVRHHAEPYALATQQAQAAELRALAQLAEARVQRLEGLEGSVPRKDIEAARTEALALRERERSIRASLGAREALVAPVSGVIARADLAIGQVVEPREVLFEVVDPARLLVEATTPDAGLASRIASASLQEGGELRLIGAARVLREGVLPLSFLLQAGAQPPLLALGQPVTVRVQLKEQIKGIVLPADAVVRNANNEPVVWIKSGAERFIPQPVQLRALDAQRVVVTQGLAADNRVVVQGAPLINQIR